MERQQKGVIYMNIVRLTISQDGRFIAEVTTKEQAVNTAKTCTKETGRPVSVVARFEDGREREVIFNPDGTNEKIWAIDRGQRMEPAIGQVYTNRGGGQYRCIEKASVGPTFYNSEGGFSNASAVFQHIESGWTFTAKGIVQYIDGTIEWDHSINGRFEQVKTY